MSIFSGLKMLEGLSDEDKKKLEIFCQEKNLRSGDILFKEGEEANAMYFLTKGSISIYRKSNGIKKVLGIVEAEEILGEMAIFGGKGKRMATAEVIEDARLITVLSFSIQDITTKYPELMVKIKNIINERNIDNNTI